MAYLNQSGLRRFWQGVKGKVLTLSAYGGSASGIVKAADKLATARKIGNASFDGSADVTLEQMGAASAEKLSQVAQAQNYATGGIALTQVAGTAVCRMIGVTVNQPLPVGSEYTLGAILPQNFTPEDNIYITAVSASTGTRYNIAAKTDRSITIQPLDANGASGDVFYCQMVWQ